MAFMLVLTGSWAQVELNSDIVGIVQPDDPDYRRIGKVFSFPVLCAGDKARAITF
jgi:hypothetical protein